MKDDDILVCDKCGTEFQAVQELCPTCEWRKDVDNRAKLLALATLAKGMKPGDAEAEAILDSAEDWTGFWPVAKEGAFTGGICGVSAAPGGGPEAGYELSEDGMYAVKIGS